MGAQDSEAHFMPEWPPEWLRPRGSLWCGVEGHPKLVIEARTPAQLGYLLAAWRCPVCRMRTL